ncbi:MULTISPECIES: SDR family oxidoreductase [Haloferax]|uniref:3-alpha-(Or 20-beta)-hydroxysteroid dehydrogenase n=1 Tax=Haloferax massiliensis TaxID=1476858 RepID=A0A0D6JRI7_9EURY|nr:MULTISPECIES: SDR family oxidoreductase [Haloferax]MDS0240368.1 SDR family oxidoreductase [Haloferax sp. S2CR25]MDS0443489.1 SDR family oxidoreductase [Haloferax sp. S2CR25-2]CQR50487.1 3-alpha-(or 20-beta)-hydroxysteroid dehydrogenase [Haloferax massiliensis]
MSLLDGHVAVVTGGSSGIGRGIALAYAEEGADVVVCDIREDPKEGGAPTHEKIEADTDSSSTYVELDVTDPAAFEAAMDAAEAFGGVDVMVNNAGIWRPEEFLDVTEDEFQGMMDINLKGVYFGAQAAARRMVESGGGSIINVSSVNGIFGNGNYPSYSASKGAVRTLSYSLAHGLGGDGVRVNAIHPGAIKTKIGPEGAAETSEEQMAQLTAMIPLGRQGEPDDVAGVAVFLASDLSKYVTGESIVVDGGWTSWR